MKTILKITGLCILFCYSTLNAQDTQKWYADDIYYDAGEKDIAYIEITLNYYDVETDSLEESYEDRMSYSMRINRFHRNYYGSSLSFNYGYFHDPYIYNGFGCTTYAYDPFYHDGWGSSYYYGHSPYYGHNWHNSWYSPWHHNHYSWHNPYGYGYEYTPYYYVTGYTSPETIYYGPRNSIGSNVPASVNNKSANRLSETTNRVSRNTFGNVSGSVNNRPDKHRPKTTNRVTRNTIIKNAFKDLKGKENKKQYTVPRNPRAGVEYSKPEKTTSPKKSSDKYERPSRSSNTGSTRTNETSTTPRPPRR